MENDKKFNWDKISKEANLSRLVIGEILNDCLNIEISIAKNVYRKKIENKDFGWYNDRYEEDILRELDPYLRYLKESEKALFNKEALRYVRANIGALGSDIE